MQRRPDAAAGRGRARRDGADRAALDRRRTPAVNPRRRPGPRVALVARRRAERGIRSGAAPIRRLLIANRGEIAVRIARTARAMGIRVVGVHAADERPPRRRRRGPRDRVVPRRRRSCWPSRVPAAPMRFTPATASWPSIPTSRAAVTEAGLTWVGPPPAAISAMGDKAAARRRAAEHRRPDRPRLRRRRSRTTRLLVARPSASATRCW